MIENSTSEASPAEVRSGLARNAFHLVLGQIATTGMAILLSAALGRGLGAADFGLYFLITTMASFSLVVVEWGQNLSLVREVARQPEKAGTLLSSAVELRTAGTVAAAGLTALAALIAGQSDRTSLFGALLVLAMLPFFLAQAFGCVFRGRERMDFDALLSVLNKSLVLVLTLAALHARLGLPGVIGALAVAGLGTLVAAALLAKRIHIVPRRGTWKAAREVLIGGTPIVAMTITVSAQGYIDALVLARMAPDTVVGWYGAAKNIIGTLIAPATILGAAAFPRMSRVAHEPLEFRRELHAALRPLLGLAALAAVGTFLFSDFAVKLIYGSKGFGPAGVTLKVFAPGLFLLFTDVLLGGAVASLGLARKLAVVKVLNVATSTVLDILLIPYFQTRYGNGGIGVVAAFALTEAMMFAAAAWLLPRGTLNLSVALDIGRALLAGAATLGIFWILPKWSDAVRLPLSIVVFAAMAGAVGLVRSSEIAEWREAIARRVRG